MDSEQRKELEHMILELEAENANLKDEYNHLKTVGVGQITLGECSLNELVSSCCISNSSCFTSPCAGPGQQEPGANSDAEMLAEAAMLREHRNRLENRKVSDLLMFTNL